MRFSSSLLLLISFSLFVSSSHSLLISLLSFFALLFVSVLPSLVFLSSDSCSSALPRETEQFVERSNRTAAREGRRDSKDTHNVLRGEREKKEKERLDKRERLLRFLFGCFLLCLSSSSSSSASLSPSQFQSVSVSVSVCVCVCVYMSVSLWLLLSGLSLSPSLPLPIPYLCSLVCGRFLPKATRLSRAAMHQMRD